MSADVQSLDEGTRKLGLLMEAAHAHQDLIDGSLKHLQAHTQGLDDVVRDEIRRTFLAEFGQLIDESVRAAVALRGLGRAAALRVAWWVGLAGAVPSAVVALLLWWWLPAPEQVAALRAERERLSAAITTLAASGARVDLRHCGVAARLCVRIDKHAPPFGQQSDYLIVWGY